MNGRCHLADIGLLYTREICPGLSEKEAGELRSLLTDFLSGRLDFGTISSIWASRFHSPSAIERLKAILDVPDEPLPPTADGLDGLNRKKTQSWTAIEDTRLLAAIHRYGTDDWRLVASFVGSNRSRSQCSQRWLRGLDPRIYRGRWSEDEEFELLRLVREYGERSWIRISNALGNRSDVQCRYRYLQLQRSQVSKPLSPDVSPQKEPAATFDDIFAFNPLDDWATATCDMFWP
jgi:hypothetical protein